MIIGFVRTGYAPNMNLAGGVREFHSVSSSGVNTNVQEAEIIEHCDDFDYSLQSS